MTRHTIGRSWIKGFHFDDFSKEGKTRVSWVHEIVASRTITGWKECEKMKVVIDLCGRCRIKSVARMKLARIG